MKILFNCLTMEKGGAERVIMLLANDFSKDNDVSILTLRRSKYAYKVKPEVRRMYIDKTSYKNDGKIRKIARGFSLVELIRYYRIVSREQPDIIISFLPEPSLKIMLVSKFSKKIKKIPKIISERNDPRIEYKSLLMEFVAKKLYKNADGMVYQTDDAKKYFDGAIKTDNQVVIQNPVDKNILIEPKSDEQRENVIISVGRLESQKNQELLINAFKKVLQIKKNDFKLEIYGEGSRRQFLQDIIDSGHLNDRVFLKGKTDDVAQKLNNSKIFVLSSRYEGMPNALIEAMAMGLPCISTDCPCGGPRSLISSNDNGILVKNEDEKALSGALNELINDKDKREKISLKALEIRKTNSLEVITKKWNKLIEDIMGGKNG